MGGFTAFCFEELVTVSGMDLAVLRLTQTQCQTVRQDVLYLYAHVLQRDG
jgi:hypothetical protein